MYTYKNKGESFEAERFTRYAFDKLWDFTRGAVGELDIKSKEPGEAFCILTTYYGNIRLREGDYVIADSKKEFFYPAPPDYFNQINEILPIGFVPPDEKEPIK